MFRHLSICGLLLFTLLSADAQAADRTQSLLIVNSVIPEGAGVRIGFTVRPNDCTTSYKGSYAFLAASVKDFDLLYLAVTTAEISGQAVTIHYIDNGDCSSLGQLLSLSNVVAQ